jgi:hypothetical protein
MSAPLNSPLAQNDITRYIQKMNNQARTFGFETALATMMGMPMMMLSPAGGHVRED